jgi:predicted transcriptional regulator
VLSDRFAAFVKSNPGLRIEQINKELGTVTKELALPIRKLLADGTITSKGQKRSTTYFPGKKSAKN